MLPTCPAICMVGWGSLYRGGVSGFLWADSSTEATSSCHNIAPESASHLESDFKSELGGRASHPYLLACFSRSWKALLLVSLSICTGDVLENVGECRGGVVLLYKCGLEWNGDGFRGKVQNGLQLVIVGNRVRMKICCSWRKRKSQERKGKKDTKEEDGRNKLGLKEDGWNTLLCTIAGCFLNLFDSTAHKKADMILLVLFFLSRKASTLFSPI